MGGQEGTDELYRAMETVEAHIKSTTKVEMMRCCCDRFKNEEHHPECPQSGAWRRLDK